VWDSLIPLAALCVNKARNLRTTNATTLATTDGNDFANDPVTC